MRLWSWWWSGLRRLRFSVSVELRRAPSLQIEKTGFLGCDLQNKFSVPGTALVRHLCCKTSPFKILWSFSPQKKRPKGAKGSVARWLCRFFFVISVDAPRRALGREGFFLVPGTALVRRLCYKTSLFRFLVIFRPKMTKRRKTFRSTALPFFFLL